MHLYTVIQVFLIAALFALKLSPAAMVYPITIVFLAPVRKVMGKFLFTHTEIEAVSFPTSNITFINYVLLVQARTEKLSPAQTEVNSIATGAIFNRFTTNAAFIL